MHGLVSGFAFLIAGGFLSLFAGQTDSLVLGAAGVMSGLTGLWLLWKFLFGPTEKKPTKPFMYKVD